MSPKPVASNPYLDEFLALGEDLNYLSYTDPTQYYAARSRVVAVRNRLVHKYAWCIPGQEALEAISRYAPIIEIASGIGYWASRLKEMDVDVVAYDIWKVPDREEYRSLQYPNKWFDVKIGSFDVVENHPDRSLFLCWPPPSFPVAMLALKNYTGRYLLYEGDEGYEPFGNHTFYDELERHWKLIETVAVPRWPEVDDRLYIYERA